MSIVARVITVVLFVWAIGFFSLLRFELNATEKRYREATEEPLVDIANIIAAIISTENLNLENLPNANFAKAISTALATPINARIYDHTKIKNDLRVYITDAKGFVVYDSHNHLNVGLDFSKWNDVARTLSGLYGARMIHADDKNPSSIMQVAAPIIRDKQLIGVVSVGKPTAASNLFAHAAKKTSILIALVTFAVISFLALVLLLVVTKPIQKLTDYVRDLFLDKKVSPPHFSSPELKNLAQAFTELIQKIEGKKYVEKYLQSLTHELKSPITALRGSIEIIKGDISAEDKTKFLENMEFETLRMQRLSDKLLTLSTIETAKEQDKQETLNLLEVIEDAVERVKFLAETKNITIKYDNLPNIKFTAHRIWFAEAVVNLLQNAIEFSPANSQVIIQRKVEDQNKLVLQIIDAGQGVPDWAKDKIFERFFSLPRPDTNKRSTGLGLSLVKEIAEMHHGCVRAGATEDGRSLFEFQVAV